MTYGVSCGFSTKVHLLCDGRGNPLAAGLSPGQDHDSRYLDELLDAETICGNEDETPIVPVKLAGDKAYRMERIDELLLQRNITPVVPNKTNEDREARVVPFDKPSYRKRSIVEQLIGWLKECHRAATRYEKRGHHFLSMVKLAMIGRDLRRISPIGSMV